MVISKLCRLYRLRRLEAEVTTAKAEATAEVAQKVEKVRLTKAYKTYEIGIKNLEKSLRATMTGPAIGRLPAMTAQAQVAEQAKAMMLPILKGIVRGAGEGVFTDADARAVLAMVPDRITDEDAIGPIMDNINAFIGSKLGQEVDIGIDATGGSTEIKSQAEYDALPSGAEYMEDGVKYRKP